jgi:hypothetical protein
LLPSRPRHLAASRQCHGSVLRVRSGAARDRAIQGPRPAEIAKRERFGAAWAEDVFSNLRHGGTLSFAGLCTCQDALEPFNSGFVALEKKEEGAGGTRDPRALLVHLILITSPSLPWQGRVQALVMRAFVYVSGYALTFATAVLGHLHGHGHGHLHPERQTTETSPLGAVYDENSVSLVGTESFPIDKRSDDPYACSPSKKCSNGACCGASGVCGYGPVYCGDGCTSNCNATASCGQYAATPGTTCPLNVCCSEFGFCGTTEDFCDSACQSNCGSPTRPGGNGDVRDRVVGYYEGWSTQRTCGYLDASQIPAAALTHVNLAFAYINPETFDIIPMDGLQESLFTKITNLKTVNPALKAYISIGGWSFNDNDTIYQPVFSNIASSSANQAKFAGNLLSFLSQYGFDGADLDWEYPGAPDRGGQEEDIANYVSLLGTIQSAYKAHGQSKGLTITIPSSYWYLRWFDLPGLQKHVDFFNLMS